MQPVYEAGDILEAHIVKGFLEQWGIEVHISGYYLQGGIGELPVSGLVRLWVADEAVARARQALAAYHDT
ncbi:hypothetical protein MIN45_P0540 [Methylomarinovum tepidoasis]|uniref:DUF2007 domain-containing protein n=1 Tax=Methylomarinovum tepidoasis TaxID=2840183 RepID=A0AAU9C8K8_9GAMM|nr:DUF2007 domain-containing protein [Methylomarinovum sp. IN45]BCX88172.1 hypothetical protein MIN45_P0540 [Methylomarinovum sp. IN45]